jgi:hypothetical protein
VVTWYWKINQITESLDRIDKNLISVVKLLKYKIEKEDTNPETTSESKSSQSAEKNYE